MPVFMLTDIEKSTEKWEKYGREMGAILARHDAILRAAINDFDGQIFKHTGDGFFAVFEHGDPVTCAISIQRRMASEDWGKVGELRVRIALHAGEAEKRGNDYFGSVINRTARILGAGWGGQILVSPEAKSWFCLPNNVEFVDLGSHLLPDLGEPQPIYALIHPDLPIKEFPPLRTLSSHPHNLPAQSTPFVGREKEFKHVVADFDNPAYRLINIVGPGGIGKTRLALQVAAEKVHDFRDGVFFVPLDSLTIDSVQFLVFTIASSLNFSFYSREDPKVQLINYLREKNMLLVLDSFEHLVGEAAVLGEIGQSAPNVRLLVTSRERLRLKGEHIVELEGMDFPTKPDDSQFAGYSAIALFVQGARAVKSDYSLSPEDRKALLRICKLVEGTPLCLELASSWMRTLSVTEIVRELEKNVDFLESSVQDVPKRHRSLRAVFEYSWELLTTKEKNLFRKLSVFEGSFSREAAEKVAGANLQMLSLCVDKSLLRRNAKGRFEMLKVLRQYAGEKMQPVDGERISVRDQHCAYYCDLMKRYRDDYAVGKEVEFPALTAEDIGNFKAAWLWAVERGLGDYLGMARTGLYQFYSLAGWLDEGEEIFRKAVETMRRKKAQGALVDKDKLLLAQLTASWGGICRNQGNYERARDLLEESLAVVPAESETDTLFIFNELGVVAYRTGDYPLALELHNKALALREIQGDLKGTAVSLNNLAVVHSDMGDYETAARLHERALKVRTEISDKMGMATSMNNLANVYRSLGKTDKAIKLYQESLELRRRINDRPGIASCLNNLGLIWEEKGDFPEAVRLYEESLALKKEVGDLRGTGNTLGNLGSVYGKLGNPKRAHEVLIESIRILRRISAKPALHENVLVLAVQLLQQKEESAGIEILLALDTIPVLRKRTKDRIAGILKDYPADKIESARKSLGSKTAEQIIEELARE